MIEGRCRPVVFATQLAVRSRRSSGPLHSLSSSRLAFVSSSRVSGTMPSKLPLLVAGSGTSSSDDASEENSLLDGSEKETNGGGLSCPVLVVALAPKDTPRGWGEIGRFGRAEKNSWTTERSCVTLGVGPCVLSTRLVCLRSAISRRNSRSHNLHSTLWSGDSNARVQSSSSERTRGRAALSLSTGHLSAGPFAYALKRFCSFLRALMITKLRMALNLSSSSRTSCKKTESSLELESSTVIGAGTGCSWRAGLPFLRFFFLLDFLVFFRIFFGGESVRAEDFLPPRAGLGKARAAFAFLLPKANRCKKGCEG